MKGKGRMMKKVIALIAAVCVSGAFSGTAAFAAEESDVTSIGRWTSRTEIRQRLGEPQNITSGGYKEIYSLSNGRTAVFKYLDDMLESGYILVN